MAPQVTSADVVGTGPSQSKTSTDPSSQGSIDLTGTGIDLHSGHVFAVEVDYDGGTLTVVISDTETGAQAEQTYTVDLAAALGGPTAWAGFTGATGALTSTQDILWWTWASTGGGGRRAGGAPGQSTDRGPTANPGELPGLTGADLAILVQQAEQNREGRGRFQPPW